jgi:hypothetical protein
MTPLLQLWPGSSAADIERHIGELGKHIGAYGPIMVDSGWIEAAASWPSHPLVVASDAATKSGLTVIPVADVDGNAADTQAAKKVAATHGAGAALRMTSDLWNSPKASVPLAVKGATNLALRPAQVDLLVDAGAVTASTMPSVESALRTHLGHLQPGLNGSQPDLWRRTVVVAGSFPKAVATKVSKVVETIPRLEWAMWLTLRTHHPTICFGDYGIAHPDPVEYMANPAVIPRVFQLRYTTDTAFALVKAGNLNDLGDDEAYDSCAALVRTPGIFDGPTYSTGDAWIAEKARRVGGSGNYTTWRRVGTAHHLTKVSRQLASRVAP